MWSPDTMDVLKKSSDENRYSQVFSNGTLFSEIYPMDIKSDSGIALKKFITELVVPIILTIDCSKEQNAPVTEFMKIFLRNEIQVTRTEPELLNQNPAEGLIQEVYWRWFSTMIRNIVPRRILDCVF